MLGRANEASMLDKDGRNRCTLLVDYRMRSLRLKLYDSKSFREYAKEIKDAASDKKNKMT